MNEETKIINELRNLKKVSIPPNEEKFLQNLRIKLSDYILAHSAIDKRLSTPWYLKFSVANAIAMPNTIIMPQKTLAVIFIICFFAAMSAIAAASQQSLPGETLYPVKILSEELRSRLADSPASKARLEINFAAKRVKEVKQIVEKNGAESENVNITIALDQLEKNTAKAAKIINEEKQKGNDVSAIAKDIEEKNSANQRVLNQILKKQEKSINEQSDKNSDSDEDKNNAGMTERENETKNKKDETKTDSSLRGQKPEAKKDENAIKSSPAAENDKTKIPTEKKR